MLVFGGENWLYTLPSFQGTTQTGAIGGDLLLGRFEVFTTARPGARLKMRGWIESVTPAIQPQKMIAYVDDRPVAETGLLTPASQGPNRVNTAANWELDFILKDTAPGQHVLSLQAVLTGHDPVLVTQTVFDLKE
jgi:hypothetical protein